MNTTKTLWQEIYSFFGFWIYTEYKYLPSKSTDTCPSMEKRKVLYWCLFPWFRFYRKYDLFSWRV